MADRSLTERLEALKRTIERGRTERARAEATIESLRKQEEEIRAELVERGVAPENLDLEIERLRDEVGTNLTKAEKLLEAGV